jgi:hypothetical protein
MMAEDAARAASRPGGAMEPASALPPAAALSPGAPVFTAGGVIGKTFSVWLANFVPFSIVTLAVYAPVFVVAAFTPPEGGLGWNLAERLLSTLAELVVAGALAYGVLESLRGGRVPAGALFGVGLRKFGAVFAVSFGVGLWLMLGVILLVVPAVVWYCALFVAVPAAVVEAKLSSSADALQRSRELTAGSRWAIFAVVLVLFVVRVAAAVVAGAVGAVAQALPQPVPVLLAVAVVALGSTLGACATAVAYHDLRLSKEGASTADLVKVFE